MEEKLLKNRQFGADADVYMDKKWWNSDISNGNQWARYNSIAGTNIKLYKKSVITIPKKYVLGDV